MIYVHYRYATSDGEGGNVMIEAMEDLDVPPPRSLADLTNIRAEIRATTYSTIFYIDILAWSVYAEPEPQYRDREDL